MNMDNLKKTELGSEALRKRIVELNSRHRRLLLLIGTKDYATMNPLVKSKIAPPEMLEQLLGMGLISA